jgi:chaperonin GroES
LNPIAHCTENVLFFFAFSNHSTKNNVTQTVFRSLVPLGDRVLVKRAPKETQTAAGIYLPSEKTKDPNEGSVIAVGTGERDVSGVLHPITLQVGDTVLLPEYGGTKVKIDDDELFLFRECDILGKFN